MFSATLSTLYSNEIVRILKGQKRSNGRKKNVFFVLAIKLSPNSQMHSSLTIHATSNTHDSIDGAECLTRANTIQWKKERNVFVISHHLPFATTAVEPQYVFSHFTPLTPRANRRRKMATEYVFCIPKYSKVISV